jgi:hypothetical protein
MGEDVQGMKPTKILAIVLLGFVGIGVVYATDVFFTPDSTSIQVVGSNVIFSTSFKTVVALPYQVQFQSSDSTDSNSWINASNTVIGTGGTITWTYTDVGAATVTQRFYRLRVEFSPF